MRVVVDNGRGLGKRGSRLAKNADLPSPVSQTARRAPDVHRWLTMIFNSGCGSAGLAAGTGSSSSH